MAALVTREPGQAALSVSVPVGGESWLVLPLPDLSPPPEQRRVLAIWLSLMGLGSAAIAIHVAGRLVRPLQLIERAVEKVGPDGMMQPLPEAGPAEARASWAARCKAGCALSLRRGTTCALP
ncbi:hypothetical protein [Paracoccus ravus]|uniref:hypothetical protein n=1 Tax=Paracoccus ravus TaxID=2447760 RepID=UPI001FD6EDFE|nr:hypothetical protein [Paracoccus ravus]